MKEVGGTRENFDVSLESWARQGVLLLNTCLTTEPGNPGAHLQFGWNLLTELILMTLIKLDNPLVIFLWGRTAQEYGSWFKGDKHFCLVTSHPSPLSAHKGFSGCGHFELCNKFLIGQGLVPVQWTLTHSPESATIKESIYLGP